MVKKICISLLILAVVISVLAFMPKEEKRVIYEGENLRVSLPGNAESEESSNGIKVTFDNIDMRISVMDVLDYSNSEVRAALPTEKLNLESGAFNANYANYAFVLELVNYILSGSPENYTPVGLSKTNIAQNNALAYSTQFTSENGEKCGYWFETVQNAKCYIIVIYINDDYSHIFDYDEEVNTIVGSLEFL